MKLNVVFNRHTVRVYGDREFFARLAKESIRISQSELDQYCEFQTIELSEAVEAGKDSVEYRVFWAENMMDFSSYERVDEREFDLVFMGIEDKDFDKVKG